MREQLVCGKEIQWDRSGGQGHCWVHKAADDLPPDVLLEIEAEIINGGTGECDDYEARNGQHYRW